MAAFFSSAQTAMCVGLMLLAVSLMVETLVMAEGSKLGTYCTAGVACSGFGVPITCFFGKNISASQNSFMIIKYSSEDFSGRDNVVKCVWGETHKLICDLHDGYTFDYRASDQATIHISQVTVAFAGQYYCHVMPPDDDAPSPRPCKLSVQEYKDTTVSSSTKVLISTTGYTVDTETLNSPCHKCSAAVLYVLPTLIITAILTIIVCFFLINFVLKDANSKCVDGIQRTRTRLFPGQSVPQAESTTMNTGNEQI